MEQVRLFLVGTESGIVLDGNVTFEGDIHRSSNLQQSAGSYASLVCALERSEDKALTFQGKQRCTGLVRDI